MMEASKFIDYYELLEISPNANSGTIERMFRYFAQRYHPDNRKSQGLTQSRRWPPQAKYWAT